MEAAEALGQAGDPRLREKQLGDDSGGHAMGEGEEAHEVELSAYEIGRVPGDGGGVRAVRRGGGREPAEWDKQLLYPNRPVVNVSWSDAEAYCPVGGSAVADGSGMGARGARAGGA